MTFRSSLSNPSTGGVTSIPVGRLLEGRVAVDVICDEELLVVALPWCSKLCPAVPREDIESDCFSDRLEDLAVWSLLLSPSTSSTVESIEHDREWTVPSPS
mmetsp:Transcript_27363/g.45247  ORF Transcript_27363/g.45247 Transcript_27363/m.45247 type:complete len:101 (+) Transcript_27363:427-729(+)